jgi:hypothetical protein
LVRVGDRNPTWCRVSSYLELKLAVDCSPEKPRTGRTVFMQSKKTGGPDCTDRVHTVWTAVRTGLRRTLGGIVYVGRDVAVFHSGIVA